MRRPTHATPVAAPALRHAHWRALDGLRGVAVLTVLAGHLFEDVKHPNVLVRGVLGALQFGWVGVDLFFVLSGFLITGILLDGKAAGTARVRYFRNFYMRRTLRIFPLYYSVLAIVLVLLPAVSPEFAARQPELIHGQGWLWGYVANVGIALRERWFLMGNDVNLNHFWSLAIEEQFYLVWPAVVWVCGPRRLATVCVVGVAAALATRVGFVLAGKTGIALGLFTVCRLDGLLMGALAAVWMRTHPGGPLAHARLARVGLAAAAVGIGATLTCERLAPAVPLFSTVGLSLVAVAFTAIVWLAVAGEAGEVRWGGRALAQVLGAGRPGVAGRVLGFFGRYSYGIYVFHWLVSPVILHRFHPWDLQWLTGGVYLASAVLRNAVWLGGAVGVAVVSWHVLEKPFLRLKRHFPD
jgi:peptidoglycan/LPS O-acetylase OafA/YrhL